MQNLHEIIRSPVWLSQTWKSSHRTATFFMRCLHEDVRWPVWHIVNPRIQSGQWSSCKILKFCDGTFTFQDLEAGASDYESEENCLICLPVMHRVLLFFVWKKHTLESNINILWICVHYWPCRSRRKSPISTCSETEGSNCIDLSGFIL